MKLFYLFIEELYINVMFTVVFQMLFIKVFNKLKTHFELVWIVSHVYSYWDDHIFPNLEHSHKKQT